MSDTFNKKEKEKQRLQKKKEKEQRKAERKANAKSGQSLEDMMAYVDENGNISSKPPDPAKTKAVNADDIVLGSRNTGSGNPFVVRRGRVTNFNTSKGYGFIKDLETHESIFVHSSALTFEIRENDIVSFEIEHTVKGPSAVRVKQSK